MVMYLTTTAAIDRLVHHSIILELNAESYRMTTAKRELIEKSETGKKVEKRDEEKET